MGDATPWFELAPEELIALPIDELGLCILDQMGSGSEARNHLVARIERPQGVGREAKQAVCEA